MTTIDKAAKLLDIFTNVPFANRNLIVDGNKEVWSASSAALATTLGYTSSVMQGGTVGTGGAGTYAQTAFAAGVATTYGLARPAKFYGTHTQTTGSTGTLAAFTGPGLFRSIEDISTTDGASLTLSIWLWVASGTLNVTQARIVQYFGTGGSPSATVNTVVPVNWNLTTAPQRFSVLLNVPSIVGKTIGTGGNHYAGVSIDLPVGATYTVNDAQWQLEYCSPQASSSITGNGGAPTAFEYRGQQAELARVQRYYQPGLVGTYETYQTSAQNILCIMYLPVTMRVAPTMSTPTGGGVGGGAAAPTVSSTTNSVTWTSAVSSTGTCFFSGYTTTADARL